MQNTDRNPRETSFDLSGGALCLDFANTWSDRGRPETDRLGSYADLLAFARQTGGVTAREADRLARWSRRHTARRDAAFERALELREALFRLFHSVARGEAPAPSDLDCLNRLLPDALCCLQVEPQDSGYAWSWAGRADSLESPLWRVAHSAAELLTGGELDRVRECDGATCTWLFLDHSRNRSRRWCDMATCGNRAKARRHYRRRRQRAS